MGTAPPGEHIWIQPFSNAASLCLFDGRQLPIASFAAGVFWVVEQQRAGVQERPALGARVGDLVAERFDGMIVPGVRGSPEERYANVVVFRPHDRWHAFVDPNEPPWKAK